MNSGRSQRLARDSKNSLKKHQIKASKHKGDPLAQKVPEYKMVSLRLFCSSPESIIFQLVLFFFETMNKKVYM